MTAVIVGVLTELRPHRMSGIWGGQTALDLYLQEHGINTLFFAGVNADQVCFSCFCRIPVLQD